MRDFTSIMNNLVVTNKVSPNKEIDEIFNKTVANMAKSQLSEPTAIFFLGFDSANFTYGNAVNVTSGGGRASFRLRMMVPAGYDFAPNRSMGGSVYIDNRSYALPYVRQFQPEAGFVQYPYTEKGGWEQSEFGGGARVKEQLYTFGFGPDCVPVKTRSFPLAFREFGFYSGSSSLPTRTMIYQKNNPAGIIEVNGIEKLDIRIQPTCDGAPSFDSAPEN